MSYTFWSKEEAGQKEENRVNKQRKTTGIKPIYVAVAMVWMLS